MRLPLRLADIIYDSSLGKHLEMWPTGRYSVQQNVNRDYKGLQLGANDKGGRFKVLEPNLQQAERLERLELLAVSVSLSWFTPQQTPQSPQAEGRKAEGRKIREQRSFLSWKTGQYNTSRVTSAWKMFSIIKYLCSCFSCFSSKKWINSKSVFFKSGWFRSHF